MKKVIIILVTLIAFSACKKDPFNGTHKYYYYIPENKIPYLKTGDVRYFVNHQNNAIIDTFTLNFKRSYQDYDKTVYHERSIDITYKKVPKKLSMSIIMFHIYVDGESVEFRDDDYSPHLYFFCNIPIDTIEELNINGTKYESVLVKKADEMFDDVPFENFPKIVYYSYKEGILRYDYSDTNYYEIKK